ncbi:hypothetical protein TRFO_11224 [Tritrichomonas foetus]|uniref:Uncharacterized protein n=1 Tax=Tritrichomonas foetus TaxID=1144522 RepID=A0A1J4J800_9EUKA|nr:hypothetical protein TRFO_11224 [Tritrichomonas foetus]|eukprot:OHS94359.1 hypothetical protein TRFO_11224 [Tritrichomonas foetus]
MSRQPPFPYRPTKIEIKQASRCINQKEGIKRPIEKYGWMTDGPLRPIETGLPLIYGSPISHSFEDVEISQRRLKEFETQISKDLSNQMSDDDDDFDDTPLGAAANDPTPLSPGEKELKKLTNKLVRNRRRILQPKTGIPIRKKLAPKTGSDIIEAIAPISFKTVKNEQKVPIDAYPFYHPNRIDRLKEGRSKSALVKRRIGFDEGSTVPLLKTQLNRVFKYGSRPFENVDKPEDFPTDPTDLPFEEEEDLEKLKKKKKKEIGINLDSVVINVQEIAGVGEKSTLIDGSDFDVFWTRNKTPFSRADVNHIFSWQAQCDAEIAAANERRQKYLNRREEAIIKTFESKRAFEKAIELAENEANYITNVGPGKSGKRRESFWIRASKLANGDNSSLEYRKKKWACFIRDVSKKTNPDQKCELQERLISIYRKELMSGKEVGPNTFWKVLSSFDRMDFTRTELCVLVEILRRNLDITRSDVISYLEQNECPTYFFILAANDAMPDD